MILLLALMLAFSGCSSNSMEGIYPEIPDSFIVGADISYLPEIEALGATYSFNGVPMDFFQILKEGNINTVRIRVWNNHPKGEASVQNYIALAQRAKAQGMKVMLVFHYSDTWADPGNQSKPSAWKDLTFEELKLEIRTYTQEVIETTKIAGVLPDFVQPGNEIASGFLWEDGRIGGDADENWDNFAKLLASAIQGIRDVDTENNISIVLHHQSGSDKNSQYWFFKNIEQRNIPYDIVGLSYYPFFSLSGFDEVVEAVSSTMDIFQKPVLIVETAYPWTFDWGDSTHNVFGRGSFLLPEYPATPEGQKQYLEEFIKEMVVAGTSGVMYWGAEWIPVPGHGSMWENLALFDFDGNALPWLYRGRER